ncbi:MAG: iron ABC transporter permease [Desulfobacteraceae bacterium]|nr:iron ABC transporter permease [Desulfobacteraceae bacterium]
MVDERPLSARLILVTMVLAMVLLVSVLLGLTFGSSDQGGGELLRAFMGTGKTHSLASVIVWRIRLPRVILAATVGATLSLGGLVFQALLRNPLAEPYILGISGGSAVGAITGMLLGFSPFPGMALSAFGGSMLILFLVVGLVAGQTTLGRDSLLLGGVMMNAFCGAIIMSLISITQTSEVHQILFWLMGDLSMCSTERLPVLIAVLPCFTIIFTLARPMNLLLAGRESAAALGVNVRLVSMLLLAVTTFMVSLVVCQSGLIGFVGLIVPHVLRLLLGSDHRLLTPACILGGGAYLILCDLLARTLPTTGEMPVGIVTALVGAPLFILLLWRARR